MIYITLKLLSRHLSKAAYSGLRHIKEHVGVRYVALGCLTGELQRQGSWNPAGWGPTKHNPHRLR